MMAKPMKTLELHYQTIQFLITADSQQLRISAHRASRLKLMYHNKTVLFYALLDIFSFLCNEATVNLY